MRQHELHLSMFISEDWINDLYHKITPFIIVITGNVVNESAVQWSSMVLNCMSDQVTKSLIH